MYVCKCEDQQPTTSQQQDFLTELSDQLLAVNENTEAKTDTSILTNTKQYRLNHVNFTSSAALILFLFILLVYKLFLLVQTWTTNT